MIIELSIDVPDGSLEPDVQDIEDEINRDEVNNAK